MSEQGAVKLRNASILPFRFTAFSLRATGSGLRCLIGVQIRACDQNPREHVLDGHSAAQRTGTPIPKALEMVPGHRFW